MPDETYNELNIDGDIRPIEDATARAEIANKMDKNNPTGSGYLSINRKSGTSIGPRSATFGYNNTASGQDATAEGQESRATGAMSHAEGAGALASGTAAHAEGFASEASGNYSHAEAQGVASGANSHAEGVATAASDFQHAGGKFNIIDSSGTYAEIIGNGTNDNNRSNARTLDWSGNETIAGDLTFNGSTSLTAALNRAKYSHKSGETFSQVIFNGLGGYVTTGSTDIWVFVPFAMLEGLPRLSDFSLEFVLRTVDGNYPYLYNGSTWQWMNTYIPIITNGTKAAGVSSVAVQNLNAGGFTMQVRFTNTLRTANNGTTAIKNNVPIAVVARISGTIS